MSNKFSLGDRVVSLTGRGDLHPGVVTKVVMLKDGSARYDVRREHDGFVYLAYEEWIDFAPPEPPEPRVAVIPGAVNGPLFESGMLNYVGKHPPESAKKFDAYIAETGRMMMYIGDRWVELTPGRTIAVPDESVELDEDERRYLRESLGLEPQVEL